MKRLVWVPFLFLFYAVIGLSVASATNIEHIVQKGDTLYHISKQYGVPVDVLLRFNDIPNARSLRVGMKLKIPDTYQVKKGDTLYSIAKDNGISLSQLLAVNHIDNSYIIKVGQVLVLPSEGGTRVATNDQVGSQTTQAPTSSVGSTAPSLNTASPGDGGQPFWPAPGKRIFLSGKLAGGTQISGGVGDPVYSVADGRVVWVGPYRGYGRVVFVESPRKYIYVYGGNETTLVKVGDTVTRGTEVANMGINPHLGQACAYFFVYKNGQPVNPRTAPR